MTFSTVKWQEIWTKLIFSWNFNDKKSRCYLCQKKVVFRNILKSSWVPGCSFSEKNVAVSFLTDGIHCNFNESVMLTTPKCFFLSCSFSPITTTCNAVQLFSFLLPDHGRGRAEHTEDMRWCVWLEFPLWKALCICVVGMTKAQSILCMQVYKLLHRPCLEREENFIITWILCFPLAQLPVFPIDYSTLQPWKCTVRLTERRKFCSELEIGGKLRILEVPICLCPTPILLLCRICSEMTSLFPTVDQPSDEHCWPWLEWSFSM